MAYDPPEEPVPGEDETRLLHDAVTAGRADEVARLLAAHADPNVLDTKGRTPLQIVAAGGHARLDELVADKLDLATLEVIDAFDGPCVAIAKALLVAGADPNRRIGPAGFTPLMIATCFGQREIVELLRERKANSELRDTLGRTAERFAVFPLVARLIRLCRRLDCIHAVYVAQIHAPVTHQFTSAAVGLELTAPLPADAFADWPADMPLVAFGLGEDAMSRLVKLTPPVHARAVDGGPKGPFSRTFTLRFDDARPAHELKHALEKQIGMLLPVDRSTSTPLVCRGRRLHSAVTFDVTLVFEAVDAATRTYALHVTASAGFDATTRERYVETVDYFETTWRKPYTVRVTAPDVRGERYADEARAAIEAEDADIANRREDLKKIDALKREFFDAMKKGRSLSSWDKDGTTELKWSDGRGVIEESDHVQVWRRDEFTDSEAFLVAVRAFYDWEISRETYPHPPLESAAWEYLIKRLHGK